MKKYNMKAYEKALIKELKSRIPYSSHPNYEKYTPIIKALRRGEKVVIPETIVKATLKDTKTSNTKDKIKEYIEPITKIEISKFYQNEQNLRVETNTSDGGKTFFELKLKGGKHKYNDLMKKAQLMIEGYNARNVGKYPNTLSSISNISIIERRHKK
jgi:hypothetical protein